MPNIFDYEGNTNQNGIEISPHSFQYSYHQEQKQQQMLAMIQENKEPLNTIGGNVNLYIH
jgi:hypothetical protein